MFQTACQFHRGMIQFDNHRRLPVDIFFQSMFAPDGLTNAYRLYRTKVYPTGKIIIDTSYFPELAQQHCLRTGAQLFSIVYPQSMHFPCRHRSYSPETFYRQTCYKPQSLVGMNGAQAIRLTVIGCYLARNLYRKLPQTPPSSAFHVLSVLFLWLYPQPGAYPACFPSHPEKPHPKR